jgi:DNA-binding response OmpR family regulator
MVKILIVDDDRGGIVKALHLYLSSQKFNCVLCDAESAFKELNRNDFDLVILDIQMPVPSSWPENLRSQCENALETGLVLYNELRQKNRELPVLFYSISSVPYGYLYDKTHYLQKPELNETVLKKVKEILEC